MAIIKDNISVLFPSTLHLTHLQRCTAILVWKLTCVLFMSHGYILSVDKLITQSMQKEMFKQMYSLYVVPTASFKILHKNTSSRNTGWEPLLRIW